MELNRILRRLQLELGQVQDALAAVGSGSTVVTQAPITGTGTTADPVDIDVFGASGPAHSDGAVPDPGAVAGTANFLREDATWAAPPTGVVADSDYGDITVSGGGTNWAIDPGAVTYAQIQPVTPETVLGRRKGGGPGDVEELTTPYSVAIDAFSQIGLTNDAAAPGNSLYYGTNAGGAKGFFAIPAGLTMTDFTQDLGTADSAGHFDITGLSGLTPNKNVVIVQTAQPIVSKGSARDEFEMDPIVLTGYVFAADTIRVYWSCPHTAVGIYAFAYCVAA